MQKTLFLSVVIATFIYAFSLSGCQTISDRIQAKRINNSFHKDLESLIKSLEKR